jgi:predicted site-specific integrase-resolvase
MCEPRKTAEREDKLGIEKRYSLSEAARLAGVDRKTLSRWLRIDLGITLPNATATGSRILLTEAQVNQVLARRTAKVAA